MKVSMWQLERLATNASSGSTAFSTEYGSGTTCGDADAGTSMPPSKCQRCARLYLLSVNGAPSRFHVMVAVYSAMTTRLLRAPADRNESRTKEPARRLRGAQRTFRLVVEFGRGSHEDGCTASIKIGSSELATRSLQGTSPW